MGLAAEGRIAARFGGPVVAGGGTSEGAAEAADRLVAAGVGGLVSFGFAGALDPVLRPGAVVIPRTVLSDGTMFATDISLANRFGGPTDHCLLAGTAVAAGAASKRALHKATGAHAIDLESGSVARVARAHGLPFVAVRAISDAADTDLPPAALLALDRQGRVKLAQVLRSVFGQPGQIAALLRLASGAARARRALIGLGSGG